MGLTFTNTAASTAAVTNRFVTSTNMIVGAYSVANPSPVWSGACIVTVTHTQVGGVTDTLGTIVVVGTDLNGQAVTDTITPVSAQTVNGTKLFRVVSSVTGAGWVLNTGNDTIVVGCAAGNYAASTGGVISGVLVNNSVAAAVTIADARGTILTVPSSQAAGTYYNLNGVDFSGWLRVSTTNTNDVTVFHSATIPSYATA
jgi:hypothetical protein